MFEFFAVLFFFFGLVVCPALAVVYGIKALSALVALVALGCQAAEDGGFHDAEAGEHVAPSQPLTGDGRPGARVVKPRQAARPGIHPPLRRARDAWR